MKKWILCIIICMLMIASIVVPISATTCWKQTSQPLNMGNILYVGGSGPNNYTKIQDAIDHAIDRDTVFVYDDSSPYQENIHVDKSLSICGENKETTIIDGGEMSACVHLQADEILLQGFTLTHSTGDHYGVRISSDENIIRGNNFTNNMIGIYLSDVNFNLIENNEITQNYYAGIYQYACGDTKISNNTISRSSVAHQGGIGVHYSHRTLITRNLLSENYFGIDISESNDNTILNNNIVENNIGICLDMASNNLIKQNNIQENHRPVSWIGVSWHLAKGKWYQNTFNENYWGRSTLLIKPIFSVLILVYNVQEIPSGLTFSAFGIIPILKFDHHPVQEPYDIPGME